MIDTLAAEYPAVTNYLYMSYLAVENDVGPSEKAPPRRIRLSVPLDRSSVPLNMIISTP